MYALVALIHSVLIFVLFHRLQSEMNREVMTFFYTANWIIYTNDESENAYFPFLQVEFKRDEKNTHRSSLG